MDEKKGNTLKKKRVYQVAKEFNIANETLIDFLKKKKFSVRNHMAPISDEMYDLALEQFNVEKEHEEKASDFRKKLLEKQKVEEARQAAVRNEINEVLELSKREVFTPVRTVRKKEDHVVKEKAKPEPPKKVPEKEIPAEQSAEIPVKDKEKAVTEGKKKTVIKIEEKEKKTVKPKEKAEEKKEAEEKPKRKLKRKHKKGKDAEEELSPKESAKKKGVAKAGIQEGGAGDKKKRKRRRKKKREVVIDEKEIEASIKQTLARMEDTGTKKKRRKKDRTDSEDEFSELNENVIKTTEFTPVAELANLMNVDPSEVIKACFSLGLMVSINQRLDKDTIIMVADEFGYDVDFQTVYGEEKTMVADVEETDVDNMEARPPVVTIMGHVDHGKTSLLDRIRESNIIAGESGGITQHIGAYAVEKNGNKITFLDTPGHEAFTAMRARGAQATDIVVLVVAADDGVMPQTVEAINHAKAAGVPLLIAINKVDLPNANPDNIKKELSSQDVLVEDWGGKVQCANVSAKTAEGVEQLLEKILLEAEVLELKANPQGPARGVIVEARMEKGKGAVATVLIQKGTLTVGDYFVAGTCSGRVRALLNERGTGVKGAGPSTPVQVLGFPETPQAGDTLAVMENEQDAREISRKRQQLEREQSFRQQRRLTLDQIGKRIAEGEVKELAVIIKADVDGSKEAIADSLMELSTSDVAVKIMHKGVGEITESDVLLAEASEAVILGFHVTANAKAKETAQKEKIDIRLYTVIYDIVNDVKLALSGLLEPDIEEEIEGTLEVRQIFSASKIGQIAGCHVKTGKINRKNRVRLIRDDEVIFDGTIASLKRFTDDVKEVTAGFECGVTLEGHNDIRDGDIIQAYKLVEKARSL